MEIVSREAAINHLDTADLDNTVILLGLQTGGFRIKDYLTHISFISCNDSLHFGRGLG